MRGYALLAVLLAACSSQIEAGGADVDAGPDDDPLTITDLPQAGTLDDIQHTFLAERCSGVPGLCHNGQFEPNLSTAANTYAYLVNRPSIEKPDRLRVAPGDPDNSVLIDKLRGRDVATQMPLGAEPLSEEEITMIEDWIRDGALRSPGAEPAPVLNNPPIPPEIGVFDDEGQRLDMAGPFATDVGETLTFRHSVRDFETPDSDIPFAVLVLSAPDGRNVVVSADPEDPATAVTTYDANSPMGNSDELNYRFDFTIPTMLELYDEDTDQISSVPASGQSFTPLVLYIDSFPDGIVTFAVAQTSILVN
jgi:hypothetical protein